MAAMTLDRSLSLKKNPKASQQRVVVDEIDGLIKIYNDGQVERSNIIPHVTCSLPPDLRVTCTDVIIDKCTNIWARLYVPNSHEKLPLMVYFHGGGFCVGSASWGCYHEFLAKLSAKSNCAILSVNYRLAPENPLPTAYDDGAKALVWLRQQASSRENELLTSRCKFSSIFLAGDSAGANIAYNVAIRLSGIANLKPLVLKGLILMQPFFGGESRSQSEKYMQQPPLSALTLAASDTYWRLSLPTGANRDHPWCNPVAKGAAKLEKLPSVTILVCISEMDILKDRNLEFCSAMGSAGNKVEHVEHKGVGHAFQILNKSSVSQTRINEMNCHIKSFISRCMNS